VSHFHGQVYPSSLMQRVLLVYRGMTSRGGPSSRYHTTKDSSNPMEAAANKKKLAQAEAAKNAKNSNDKKNGKEGSPRVKSS
jgi:hypothetical protein